MVGKNKMKTKPRKKIEETKAEYLKRTHKINNYKDWGELRLKLLNKNKKVEWSEKEFREMADLI